MTPVHWNFVSSQRTLPRERGAVLEVEALRGADGVARIVRVGAVPLWVRFDRPERRRVEVLPLREKGDPEGSGRLDRVRRQVLDLLTRGARAPELSDLCRIKVE